MDSSYMDGHIYGCPPCNTSYPQQWPLQLKPLTGYGFPWPDQLFARGIGCQTSVMGMGILATRKKMAAIKFAYVHTY